MQTGGAGTPFEVSGKHKYKVAGAYPIVVNVHDNKDDVDSSVVNLSHQAGNQSGGSIAADPFTPGRLFAVSATDQVSPSRALFAATSTDGGLTWTPTSITGGTVQLPTPVAGSPKAVFDRYGQWGERVHRALASINEWTRHKRKPNRQHTELLLLRSPENHPPFPFVSVAFLRQSPLLNC